jgi:hypothetical protein
MKSGHVGRCLAWLAWIVICASASVTCTCVTRVHAQSRVVCAGFDDAELLARVRGQTRDLPIVLVTAASANVTQPSAEQLQAIARDNAAELVVSVDEEPNGARVVYVFDARTAELRVRKTPAPQRKQRFARSAAAETLALIVRGELSDILRARALEARAASEPPSTVSSGSSATSSEPSTARTERARSEAKATAKPAPREEPAAAAQTEPEPEPEPEPEAPEATEPEATEPEATEPDPGPSWLSTTQLSLELAGRVSTPVSKRYFWSGALTLRWSFEHASIGVTAATSLANRAEREGLTLTLREHSVGIDVLAHLPVSAAFRLGFGAAGRLSLYQRTANSSDPSWRPEPSSTSRSVALGPQAELRWQLAEHIGVNVRIGLDVLLRPVSWRYSPDASTRVPVELERQNRTEPWLSLGVFGSL